MERVGFGNTKRVSVDERGGIMKNDPRVRYTQTIIKKAFLELLHQKPMNKITVREICERAEINRSTFYKHYLDCYDLVDQHKEEALLQLDDLMADMEGNEAMPVLLAILQAMKNHADTFKLFGPGAGAGEFTRQAVQRCYRYLDLHLSCSPRQGWAEWQKEISCTFLIGGISSVIEQWMQCGCKEPPEQIAEAVLSLSEIVTAGLAEKQP